MHRLTHNQKTVAVKILKHLRDQPEENRKTQRQIAEAVGLSQPQMTRYLRLYNHLRITAKKDKRYVWGPKAEAYLADWAVYFMERAQTK